MLSALASSESDIFSYKHAVYPLFEWQVNQEPHLV